MYGLNYMESYTWFRSHELLLRKSTQGSPDHWGPFPLAPLSVHPPPIIALPGHLRTCHSTKIYCSPPGTARHVTTDPVPLSLTPAWRWGLESRWGHLVSKWPHAWIALLNSLAFQREELGRHWLFVSLSLILSSESVHIIEKQIQNINYFYHQLRNTCLGKLVKKICLP